MENIIIRDAVPDDAGQIQKIYSYYVENTAITFDYDIPSVDYFKEHIINTQINYPYLVISEGSRILGYCYARAFVGRKAYQYSCEVTVYLDHDQRKKGLGRLLYEELEKRLRSQGILNLYACIGDPVTEDEYLDSNSEHFHSHMGFVKNGEFHKCGYKFGRWYNMIWMEKIIGPHN